MYPPLVAPNGYRLAYVSGRAADGAIHSLQFHFVRNPPIRSYLKDVIVDPMSGTPTPKVQTHLPCVCRAWLFVGRSDDVMSDLSWWMRVRTVDDACDAAQ